MGCASSAPLVESGKNLVEAAKETATEAVNKSEKALHDVSETAIDGINSGVDAMKETMQSAFNSAENNVNNVVGKIGKTFSFTSSDNLKNTLKGSTTNGVDNDDFLTNMSDAAGEAVSEAETVLLSEAEQAKNSGESLFHSMYDDIKTNVQKETQEVNSKVSDLKEQLDNDMKNQLNEMKNHANELKSQANDFKDSMIETLDDLEDDADKHFDMLGDNVKNIETKVEEVLKNTVTSPEDVKTIKEQIQQKEE